MNIFDLFDEEMMIRCTIEFIENEIAYIKRGYASPVSLVHATVEEAEAALIDEQIKLAKIHCKIRKTLSE